MRPLLLAVIVLGLAPPSTALTADSTRAEPGIRYLYLVRHGMYERDPAADDRIGNGLNALGREQARWIGDRLAGLPRKPARLVSSDFTRARETADTLGAALGMNVERDSLIQECQPASGRASSTSSAGEIARCDSSLAAAWTKYVRPSSSGDAIDVLVCHGNVIRWFVVRSLGLETRSWWTMDIGNASLTVIAVRPDGTTRLVMFSDVGHLPLDRQTWAGRGPGWVQTGQR